MTQKQLKRCPVGIQTFSEVVKGNYLYVDKTALVYDMANTYKFCFLSRPRRFGKSLLTSTLHSYFAGERELFRGLAMERLETEWTQYPVLHFDMSGGKGLEKDALEEYLGAQLREHERIYGITPTSTQSNIRLLELIKAACRQTGQQAVVLIDEYDAPLLDVVHEEEQMDTLRNVMRNFYAPLKMCDPYLRFVFLTGITKFSQLSIFSELNNLTNISMDEEYAAICGITKEELLTQMSDHVDALAQRLELSREETLEKLRVKYDGYHFCWPSPDLYNPFSLLGAMAKRKLDNYWFSSGTPLYLIRMLRKFNVLPSQIGKVDALDTDFDAPTERMTSITPLLYQSGYLTIKDYDRMMGLYKLDIPNNEIRVGLMNSLLPNYVAGETLMGRNTVAYMYRALMHDDLDGMMRQLQEYLLTVPYCDNTHYEGHYQQMLYVILSLLGMYVDVEVRTATGRVDMVLRMPSKIYLLELKVGKSAQAAMRQMDLKDYPKRFALSGLPVVKVAADFDMDTRTLSGWVVCDN